MHRHLIYGRYGSEDTIEVSPLSDERTTQLSLLNLKGKLNYGVGHALDHLKKIGIYPSETGIDLLILAAHIQAADINISRKTESQDCWTREIRILVPVTDLVKWNSAKQIIKRALDFLTGDIWTINFRQRPNTISRNIPTASPLLTGIPYNNLSLFSGGLDSLIGAIDILENGGNPLFISHVSDGPTNKAQENSYNKLKENYKNRNIERLRLWMNFPDVQVENSEHEKTTRARSFLFFAIGLFAGSGFQNQFILKVPENGLIALNVPLDRLRLGAHSTRTTHPFYIARLNEILGVLGINGKIENPYWDKTKGEMVSMCRNQTLLKTLVPSTLSCSSPTKDRWRGIGEQHCGYCLPCLIRRAALESGLGSDVDTTSYTLNNLHGRVFDTLKAEGKVIRSFQLAINRMHRNPNIARIIIHKSGPLNDRSPDELQALANVYGRGMNEVANLLSDVNAVPNPK